MGKIVQNALCEKLRILPRGKPIAGTRAMGSFCEVAREAKGRTQRRKADIFARDKWELEEGRVKEERIGRGRGSVERKKLNEGAEDVK